MPLLCSRPLHSLQVLLALFLCLAAPAVPAAEVRVAVAANFRAPLQALADGFTLSTGHTLALSSGSTGRFGVQIRNGAPFEVLLSADAHLPEQLEREGLAVRGTRFTYAIGRLVLWSPKAGLVDPDGAVLGSGNWAHLAVANAGLAPYGAAAVQVLNALGLEARLRERFVQGEDIGQTFQFVASGNADLGFVALSQVPRSGSTLQGSSWVVPQTLYAPLRQDAVLLKPGRDKPAAQALLRYLRSPEARAQIAALGYGLPDAEH